MEAFLDDFPKIIAVEVRHYPTFDPTSDLGWSENPPPVKAVLVEGDIGDYSCYMGIGPTEWVARHGDKISFTEACCYFPFGLEKEKYRS